MPFVAGPEGRLEVKVVGAGEPVTVFAHGLAGSIAETRPFAAGVAGTRVFFSFRSHGQSVSPRSPWSYAALELELMAVRDAYGARRGLGVSLGAGALLRAAVHRPDLFERLVLVLPAALDAPRSGRAVHRVAEMAERAEAGDVEGLSAELLAEQPAGVRDRRVVQMWARQQAEQLCEPMIRRSMLTIPLLHPLDHAAVLESVTCPVLVVGQVDDEAHPSAVVDQLASVLPDATTKVFGPGGLMWTHRAELRPLISDFLNT
ncbi:MAG: alpha/beta fold hydrolase [Nocardioidaceae bacterium]